jgi:hypothetical protein
VVVWRRGLGLQGDNVVGWLSRLWARRWVVKRALWESSRGMRGIESCRAAAVVDRLLRGPSLKACDGIDFAMSRSPSSKHLARVWVLRHLAAAVVSAESMGPARMVYTL